MANKSVTSIKYLRQRLRYEPETGKLYWRDDQSMPSHWRTRYAETEAFTTDNGKGYKIGRINNKAFQAHRVAWALHHGRWPNDVIDHLNHDPSDNRMVNLRETSFAENMRNQVKRKNNTSGVVGVYWYPRYQKWMASIKVNGAIKHIGYFNSIDEAATARKVAQEQYGFHANHGVKAPAYA